MLIFSATMSWPLVVLPMLMSLVSNGCWAAVLVNSSLIPPAPPYFLKTSKPAAACAVARWVTVWPSISFGVMTMPPSASSCACSPLRIVSTCTADRLPVLAFDRSISWRSIPSSTSLPSASRGMSPA